MIRKVIGSLLSKGALAGALVLCAYAYYLKSPSVRELVDARLPVVKDLSARMAALWAHGNNSETASAPGSETAAQAAPTAGPAPETAAMPAETPQPAEELVAEPLADTVDLTELSQSPAKWPKVVGLKRAVAFPAVLDGKVVGSIRAPAGTQAHLIVIKDGKAGVEYQGGGAMVEISDTDLIERVRASRQTARP